MILPLPVSCHSNSAGHTEGTKNTSSRYDKFEKYAQLYQMPNNIGLYLLFASCIKDLFDNLSFSQMFYSQPAPFTDFITKVYTPYQKKNWWSGQQQRLNSIGASVDCWKALWIIVPRLGISHVLLAIRCVVWLISIIASCWAWDGLDYTLPFLSNNLWTIKLPPP